MGNALVCLEVPRVDQTYHFWGAEKPLYVEIRYFKRPTALETALDKPTIE